MSSLKQIIKNGLSKTMKRDKLRKQLKSLYKLLKEDIDNNDDVEFDDILNQLAKLLSQKHIISHKSEDIRSYAASCIAEILYLSDNNDIFTNENSNDIFLLLADQMKGLSIQREQSRYKQRIDMFESLMNSNIHIILCKLHNDRNGELDILYRWFEKCIDMANQHLNSRIEYQIKHFLIKCLEELDEITTTLLHIILRYLVTPYKDNNDDDDQRSYELASSLLFDAKEILQDSITRFIRQYVLCDNDTNNHIPSDFDSPFGRKVVGFELIIELANITPEILTYICQDCPDLLINEDENIRSQYIDLWMKCVTNENSNFSHLYPLVIESLLGRFVDSSTNIRVKMCKWSTKLLKCQHLVSYYPKINDLLRQRTRDEQSILRYESCKAIINLCTDNIENIDELTLQAVGLRVGDKKVDVRTLVIKGLSKLFSQYVSEYWQNNESLPNAVKKCIFIPSKIIAAGNGPFFLDVYNVFIKEILSLRHSALGRCRTLIGVYTVIPTKLQNFLNAFLRNIHKHRMRLITLLNTSKDEYDTINFKGALHFLSSAIAQNSSEITNVEKNIKYLISHRNKKVVRWLNELCSVNIKHQDAIDIINELQKVIRSSKDKFPEKIFKKIIDICLLSLHTNEYAQHLLNEANEKLKFPSLVRSSLLLLYEISKNEPNTLISLHKKLFQLKDNKNLAPEFFDIVLKIISKVPYDDSLSKVNKRMYQSNLESEIDELPVDKLKFIVRALYNLNNNMINSLWADFSLRLDNVETLPQTLRCCSEMIKLDYENSYDYTPDIAKMIMEKILVQSPDVELQCNLTLLRSASKFMTNYLISLPKILEKTENDMSIIKQICYDSMKSYLQWLITVLTVQPQMQYDDNNEMIEQDDHLKKFTFLINLNGNDCDMLYLQASLSFLKLLRSSQFRTLINPKYLMTLSLAAQHDNDVVRAKFTEKVYLAIKEHKLHFSFCVWLAYSATDPNGETLTRNKRYLSHLIELRRKLNRLNQLTNDNRRIKLPESILSDLLYYLSHHPDFEEEDESSKRYFGKIIDMFLDCLLTKSHPNYAVVMQLLAILRESTDTTTKNNSALYFMIELSLILLKQRYQNRSWVNSNQYEIKDFEINKHFYDIAPSVNPSASINMAASASVLLKNRRSSTSYHSKKNKRKSVKKSPSPTKTKKLPTRHSKRKIASDLSFDETTDDAKLEQLLEDYENSFRNDSVYNNDDKFTENNDSDINSQVADHIEDTDENQIATNKRKSPEKDLNKKLSKKSKIQTNNNDHMEPLKDMVNVGRRTTTRRHRRRNI